MVLTKRYIIDKINARRNDIIEISGLVRKMLIICDKSIRRKENFKMDELIQISDKVKEFRKKLDDENVKLVIDRDLHEEDLRLIIGGMRMVSNLDKIGRNIVQVTEICKENNLIDEYDSFLTTMMGKIFVMFDGAFVGFIYREIDNCYEAIKEDLDLDGLKVEKTGKITEIMMESNDLIVYGMNIIEIISSLERIGDYIVNIAEDIVYIYSGEDIRYKA
jgi:phosphate transport system protein